MILLCDSEKVDQCYLFIKKAWPFSGKLRVASYAEIFIADRINRICIDLFLILDVLWSLSIW